MLDSGNKTFFMAVFYPGANYRQLAAMRLANKKTAGITRLFFYAVSDG